MDFPLDVSIGVGDWYNDWARHSSFKGKTLNLKIGFPQNSLTPRGRQTVKGGFSEKTRCSDTSVLEYG